MSTILLVDDEYPAIEAIQKLVDWEKLGFTNVLTADSVQGAREHFLRNKIQVLLCDIEMPGENGLDLLGWIKRYSPDTVGVFLTCHSDFNYAKQAVRMGAFDYLLKPAAIEDIENVLVHALDEWNHRKNITMKGDSWERNKSSVIEHLWWEIFNGRMPASKSRIKAFLERRNLKVDLSGDYLLVSCAIRRWGSDLATWEEYDLDYMVRNVLGEVFEKMKPYLITETTNKKIILLNICAGAELNTVKEAARKFQDFMKHYFQTRSCFYIGNICKIEELAGNYQALCNLEKNNVSYDDQIFYIDEQKQIHSVSVDDSNIREKWKKMLMDGKGDVLCIQLRGIFRRMIDSGEMNRATMVFIYHNVIQIVYSVLAEYNISAQQLLQQFEEGYADAVASSEKMEKYLEKIIMAALEYIRSVRHQEGVIGKIKKYIDEHLDEDLSRNTLAKVACLNPNYLARLFHSKTGDSLVDYITKRKMEKVKKLLLTTDLSVSQIALMLGYTNMPYFSKVFKKETGCSPIEYRRQNSLYSEGAEQQP